MSLEPPPTVPCPRCGGDGYQESRDPEAPLEACDCCEARGVVELSVLCAWERSKDCARLLRGPDPYSQGYRAHELRWVISHGLCEACKPLALEAR